MIDESLKEGDMAVIPGEDLPNGEDLTGVVTAISSYYVTIDCENPNNEFDNKIVDHVVAYSVDNLLEKRRLKIIELKNKIK